MTPDEILNSPEYLYANTIKYLHRYRRGHKGDDLDKAKFYLDKLIEYEVKKDDHVDIDLLAGFEDALLGAVYEADGNPVPCYDSTAVIDQLVAEGMSEGDAVDYLETLADGMKVLWIRELELDARPKDPHLRICH